MAKGGKGTPARVLRSAIWRANGEGRRESIHLERQEPEHEVMFTCFGPWLLRWLGGSRDWGVEVRLK